MLMWQSCSAASSPPEAKADGQLPSIFLAEWEVDNYIRPNYSVTATVDNLHGWVRVAGENEFDLQDRGYGEKHAGLCIVHHSGGRKSRDRLNVYRKVERSL